MNTTLPPPPPGTAPKKKRGGCLLYGCLTVIVLFIVIAIGTFYVIKSFANRMVDQLADSKPMPIEQVQIDENDYQEVWTRVSTFVEDVRNANAQQPLVLTAQELNTLIVGNPEAAFMRDKVRVDMSGDTISGTVSIPLGEIPIAFLQYEGKYLNASFQGKLTVREGVARLRFESAQFKGQNADEALLAELNRTPIAEKFLETPRRDHPEVSEFLDNIEGLDIKDGKMVIRPKVGGSAKTTG